VIDLLVEVTERCILFQFRFELSDQISSEWWQNYNHDISLDKFGLTLPAIFSRRNESTTDLAVWFHQRYELSYRIPYIDRKQKQDWFLILDYFRTARTLLNFTDNQFFNI